MNIDFLRGRLTGWTAASRIWRRAHTFNAHLFSLIAVSLLSGGCVTPTTVAPAVSMVTIREDLRFELYPPGGGPRYDILISAGQYMRSDEDGPVVYFSSPGGSVSRVRAGQPTQKRRGGLAYSRKVGRYFAWQAAPSYDSVMPLNGVLDEFTEGPSVRIFLGYLPADAERQLQIER